MFHMMLEGKKKSQLISNNAIFEDDFVETKGHLNRRVPT